PARAPALPPFPTRRSSDLDALAAVRRARRLRPAQEAPALALAEADALLGLLRYREAVVVATRALRRGADHEDVEAGLRVVRGHGDRKSTRLNSSHVSISYA